MDEDKQKRRRLERNIALRAGGISSTSSEEHFQQMLAWLSKNGAKGLSHLRFGPSQHCGNSLGGFANKDFANQEFLFSIPQRCMFGLHQCIDTPLSRALRRFADFQGYPITSELLIWLGMISAREYVPVSVVANSEKVC